MSYAAVLVDLQSGRKVRRVPTGDVPPREDTSFFASGRGQVTDLALTAGGSLAFIYRDLYGPDDTHEVRVADGAGIRSVDSGADVGPRSLSLGDGAITWQRGTETHSAPFGP